MSTLPEVRKEIYDITAKLIEIGLSSDQNFPSERDVAGNDGAMKDLTIPKASEISSALRNRPYEEIYRSLSENRAYNMKLVDGAMIQLRYRFNAGGLKKHVLAFYPSPDLLEFQNDPELYENEILYADIVSKDVVTTPVRFDFDPEAFEERVHPMSHFTIGQYKNCRIAVSSALTPFRFINFILRAFFNTPYLEHCSDMVGSAADFPRTATDDESRELHLSFST